MCRNCWFVTPLDLDDDKDDDKDDEDNEDDDGVNHFTKEGCG